MVMNKKGFLKIMEAIIAIIIVLSFVISIMPIKTKDTSKLPPDLEQTTNTILHQMQNKPEFRQCVLGGGTIYDFANDGSPTLSNSTDCIYNYTQFISYPAATYPWNYAVKVCNVNSTNVVTNCSYTPRNGVNTGDLVAKKESDFANKNLPIDKDIYTRTIVLASPDVFGIDPNNVQLGNYSVLTLYAWLKG